MIKVDVMYALYVYVINMKMKQTLQLITEYNEKLKTYLPTFDTYRSVITTYVNFEDLIQGRIKELPLDSTASTDAKFVNISVKDYYRYKEAIKTLTEDYKGLHNKRIPIKTYKEVIRRCNNKIGEWLLATGKTFTSPFFGSIKLRFMDKSNRPNWGKSNKKKQEIIDRGGIPYNKEEEERCKKAGIPYHGEKWIEGYPEGILTATWKRTYVSQFLPTDMFIRFSATRGNYGLVNMLSKYYATNPDLSKFEPVDYKKKNANKI